MNTADTVTTAPASDDARETLTLATACDACGYVSQTADTRDTAFSASPVSRAYVLVFLRSGRSLALCGHHYAANEPALLPLTESIDDERSLLLTPVTSSANA